MSAPISYVTCPSCRGEFYIHRPDFEAAVDARCYCPFCRHTFGVQDGQPRPPVAPSRTAGA